jgi:hypothetical protein
VLIEPARARAAACTPPPPPAVPIPTERVELAPEPTISLYAYTTLMTFDSERRSYRLQLAFHADSGIEWVGEWVDCHTQTEAYRRRAPTKL